MDAFIAEFYAISVYQWLATVFSLVYIFYAVKNHSICFVFGLLSAVFWAYESYFLLHLKFDSFLQVFYIAMSIYGLYVWMRGGEGRSERAISFFGLKPNASIVLLGLGLSYALYTWTQGVFDTDKAFIDLLTTVFSVIATFLLIHRYIDNWIYWVVIDLVYVYLYWGQGGYLFSMIMVIYTIMAIIGYKNWKNIYLDAV